QGAHFEDWSLPATAPPGTSAFASISDDGKKIVAVVLNLDPEKSVTADLEVNGCGATVARHFSYAANSKKLEHADSSVLEPFSIHVFELTSPCRRCPAAGPRALW